MAMISGPFTDEIVRMLRGTEDGSPAYGDVLFNGKKQYGILDDGVVYVSADTIQKVSYTDFVSESIRVLRFPEPYGDGFRLTDAFGTVWVPEFTEAERDFLKKIDYQVHDAESTVKKIKGSLGKKQHPLYAISCKTGVMVEDDVRKLAICLQKVM